MTEPLGPNADHGYWASPSGGQGDPWGLPAPPRVSILGSQPSWHSKGARPVLWGLGDSHGPQPGYAGCPSLQAGFGREIYFCLDGPTGPSVSIKGPESSPGQLTLSTCCYSLKQARTWGAAGRRSLLQPQGGGGRGGLAPRRMQPCLSKYGGPMAGQTPGTACKSHSFLPWAPRSTCSKPTGPQKVVPPGAGLQRLHQGPWCLLSRISP